MEKEILNWYLEAIQRTNLFYSREYESRRIEEEEEEKRLIDGLNLNFLRTRLFSRNEALYYALRQRTSLEKRGEGEERKEGGGRRRGWLNFLIILIHHGSMQMDEEGRFRKRGFSSCEGNIPSSFVCPSSLFAFWTRWLWRVWWNKFFASTSRNNEWGRAVKIITDDIFQGYSWNEDCQVDGNFIPI